MGKTQKTENQIVSEPQSKFIDETKFTTYVVLRDGFRVSDRRYESKTDPEAISEKEFWSRVERNHSYGAPVSIVQYDSAIHRVW